MTFFDFYKLKSNQKAQTPDWLKKWVSVTFGKYFDPCPANPGFDGLSIPWKTINYVNPPFDDIGSWMDKASCELKKGKTSIFLVPFRAHTNYFLRNVSNIRCSMILDEEIAFKGYKEKLSIALHICVFSPHKIPRNINGLTKQCTSYVTEIDNLKELKMYTKKICRDVTVIGSSISEPLSKVLKKKKNAHGSFAVICPTRMSNKVLSSAFMNSTMMIFANTYINSKRDHKFALCVILFGKVSTPQNMKTLQLYSLNVNSLKK
jgi:hypothetical protein